MFMRTIGRGGIKPFIFCALSFAVPFAAGQTPVAPDGDSHAKPATEAPASNSEIERLRQMILEQQRQIDELKRAAAQKGQDSTVAAKPDASAIAAPSRGVGEIASTAPILPPLPAATTLGTPLPLPQAAAADQTPSSPLQIRVGDASITPVGFMDMTNTWRSTNSGASLATNFGNFPYSNTPTGNLTENRMSAQNSRLGLRVDATAKGAHVLGYYEGDFVGFAPTNSQVTSNSMTYRLRLYWINVRKGKWEFQAGQSWSLLVPNRKGLSALPGDLFYGQEFDVNYLNGLTWGRLPGYRLIGHPSDKVTWGLSLENSEQYIGGSGGASTSTLPAAFAGNNFNNQFNNGNTNTSVPNLLPDIIAKIAFEPSSHFHIEIAGIERTFKTYNPATQQHFTKAGGGASLNLTWEVVKNLRLVSNNFWSDGGGRYLFGQAPDVIVRADGSPSPVHSGSMIQGIEAQKGNLLLYAYYGGILIGRDSAIDTNGKLIGWGYDGASNAQNRTIQEGTFGLIHTLWKDSKYGALQWMFQYAYFTRSPYNFVASGTPNNAHQHAVWFNLRYVLPGTAPTIKY
jgi:hypothetical protein